MAKDYYKTLEINRSADEGEIKKAFRRLAKQYHPDTNPGNPTAEARFKEINEAYEVLGDPKKRAQYDRFGGNFPGYGGQKNGGGAAPDFETGNSGAWSEVIDSIFGGFGARGRKSEQQPNANSAGQPGRDIEHDIHINLREAYEGTTRYITKGSRRIKVNIPPGASKGTKVRLAGEGEDGPSGPGDLYLVVQVEEHEHFEREGDDLYVEVEIDMISATLGGELRVPTMVRPVKLKVPPGTQSGQKFRITGKGMPKLRQKDQYGDLYARVMVTVPTDLTPTQRELLMQFKESLS